MYSAIPTHEVGAIATHNATKTLLFQVVWYILLHVINGLKVAGLIGGGALMASVVAAVPSETQTVQSTPTPAAQQRTVVPAANTNIPKVTTNDTPSSVKNPPINIPDVAPKPSSVPTPTPKPAASSCHPGYSGCLKQNAGDYDCAGGSGNGPNYTGKVRVYGSDPFGLDGDNDGWGCEK